MSHMVLIGTIPENPLHHEWGNHLARIFLLAAVSKKQT